VHIASNDDDQAIGVGITSDDVVHLANQDPSASTSLSHSRAPIDQSRWSHSYSGSIRSRSSLVRSNSSSGHDNSSSSIQPKTGDLSWQPVDERDEVELVSDADTEDTDSQVDDLPEEEPEEERTSAIVIAEEGRGLIVRGDGVAISDLVVLPGASHVRPTPSLILTLLFFFTGTTHLLIGSSSNPSALPAFLTNVLPAISTTLLALDISANFLGALPPALESCVYLEELNVSSNPLRALPLFIAQLTSLRVLIADSTGLTTLPASLSVLDKLHTLSVRRNKMYSLPSWLCLLISLQTLLVDGNPFHGPWKALMEPLLAKSAPGLSYTPSTPNFPPPSVATQDADSNTDTDGDDSQVHQSDGRVLEDEDTITPVRAPVLGRAATAPNSINTVSAPPSRGVTRTRTVPNSSFLEKNRGNLNASSGPSRATSVHSKGNGSAPDSVHGGEKEPRRMKSAGELRPPPTSNFPSTSPTVSTGRFTRSQYVTSASSSNLLDSGPLPQRFATVGRQSQFRGHDDRTPLDHLSPWDEQFEHAAASAPSLAQPSDTPDSSRPPIPPRRDSLYEAENLALRQRSVLRRKDDKTKDQSGRWGFLKKMSMGKLKPDAPGPKPSSAYVRPGITPLANVAESVSVPPPQPTASSQNSLSLIDVRLSSTGSLGLEIPGAPPEISISPIIPEGPNGIAPLPSPSPSLPPSPSLLSLSNIPPSPNLSSQPASTRVAKRRSFLPIGGPPTPLPLPSPGPLTPSSLATTANDGEQFSTPSPISPESAEQTQRREEDRARDAYTRALRSVMAYLRDMNDLSVTQHSLMSMYAPSTPDITGSGPRPRRPTATDGSRVVSDGIHSSPSSVAASRSGSSDQLRSPESIAHLRSLNSSQTASIATTDSAGSTYGEERKFKDDAGRRMRVVKEIVEYVETFDSSQRLSLSSL